MSLFRQLLMQSNQETYTTLNYIQGQGQQYLDLGYYPTLNTSVEYDVMSASEQTVYEFGTSKGWLDNVYGNFLYYLDWPHWYMSNSFSFCTLTERKPKYNVRYSVKFSKSGLVIDNYLLTPKETFNPTVAFNNPYPMYLFVQNSGVTPTECSTVRFYFFKIFENGALVKHLVPAKRNSDNSIGMLDILSNVFYENKGSGTFLYA